ncbi:hypothetical protein [Nocardia alni]|uniref:hypothetical protein n=1 Tax=Nocardia alni TaxID=2815723 RepID=UPI001C246586|nr:hypothetical protein [Nocardia alni]
MNGTLVDVPTAYLSVAQPNPGAGPVPGGGPNPGLYRKPIARPIPAPDGGPQAPGGRPERSDTANIWQEAKTVVVTRVSGPQALVTVPRLVVPIGHNQLAFRVSSYATEADELSRDPRVLVQPGDWRGNPSLGSQQRQGQAQVITGGTLLPYVQTQIEAKYRWRTSVARMAHRLARGAAPYGDTIVLVTVYEPVQALMPGR